MLPPEPLTALVLDSCPESPAGFVAESPAGFVEDVELLVDDVLVSFGPSFCPVLCCVLLLPVSLCCFELACWSFFDF